MSEIEKAAEDRIRAIAREEIEAALEPMPKVYVVKTTPINQEGGEANSPGRHEFPETGLDKSPPAVEAPAAGGCPHCNGSGFIIPDTRTLSRIPKCPRCYGSGKAEDVVPRNAVEAEAMEAYAADHADLADMTALARRLAEALRYLVERCEHQPSGPKYAAALDTQGWRERKALDDSHTALAEARKHKLIE